MLWLCGACVCCSEEIANGLALDGAFVRQREKAIGELYSVGVYCQPRENEFMWNQLGDEAVRRKAARLSLRGFSTVVEDAEFGYGPTRGTDELTDQILLDNLKWFPEITSLTLISTDITDRGLEAIVAFRNLEEFELLHFYPPIYPSLVTDDGMKVLAQCKKLRRLRFLGTKLSDKGAAHLASLPNLEQISIEATHVTPDCLQYLVNATRLEQIHLRGNRCVSGRLSYRDVAEYDHLGKSMSRNAEKVMAVARGVPRRVRIDGTLVVDPTVFGTPCRTPAIEEIELFTDAVWRSTSVLAALHEQEHLKYVRCDATWNATSEGIQALENVRNDTVHLAVHGQRLGIDDWLKWAREEVSVRPTEAAE